MVIGENVKWVIVEVGEVEGEGSLFIAPLTLKLEPGFVGTIVWFVFTPGWQLSANGVEFDACSGFDGQPQPDPNRPNCWSTAAANTQHPASFPYTINVRHMTTGATLRVDPVVENEAPPGLQVSRVPSDRRDLVVPGLFHQAS